MERSLGWVFKSGDPGTGHKMADTGEAALFADGELAEVPEKIVSDAVAIYNAIAKRLNVNGMVWREALAITAKRRTKLKAALKDYGGVRGWQQCLERAARNRFLLGKEGRSAAHRNWKPELDFFLQEKTVLRLVEGGYPADDGVSIEKPRLKLPTIYGKKAEEKPFVPEDRATRLQAAILSYRKIGNYARANAIEEQLAALENRAPVLVPSPDAKDPDVVPFKNGASSEFNGRSRAGSAPKADKFAKGPIIDIPPADLEQARRAAFMAANEPPGYDAIPEGDFYGEE